MSTLFQQTAYTLIAKNIDRYPLIKLSLVIDWRPIEQHLNRHKTRYIKDNRGRPAYNQLSMFKAILLGQWHSLSDIELEHSIITRIDFNLFCGFDEMHIPDHSTLCRYRNWLAQSKLLDECLSLINRELADKGLKVKNAQSAVIDATIIETAGGKQRRTIETDGDGTVTGQSAPSKDPDARWIKKDGKYRLGYKQHTRTDAEGYIEKVYATSANAHESQHLTPLLKGLRKGVRVYADKGYSSQDNRHALGKRHLLDGIMEKAHRGKPLTEAQKQRNNLLSKTRYVIEQSFGTLHRKFRHSKATYFGVEKVTAQCCLKAICLNLLKAANRLRVPIAA